MVSRGVGVPRVAAWFPLVAVPGFAEGFRGWLHGFQE